jgi:hypothetical protein
MVKAMMEGESSKRFFVADTPRTAAPFDGAAVAVFAVVSNFSPHMNGAWNPVNRGVDMR